LFGAFGEGGESVTMLHLKMWFTVMDVEWVMNIKETEPTV
jgi:hypothetical protein